MLLDAALVQLYARALVAIARSDDAIDGEEAVRLQERIDARAGQPFPLDDLLLAEPLEPAQLAAELRASASPFRGGLLHPGELARMLVADGVTIAMAKGHLAEAEAMQIIGFARALGCSGDELREMSVHLVHYLGR